MRPYVVECATYPDAGYTPWSGDAVFTDDTWFEGPAEYTPDSAPGGALLPGVPSSFIRLVTPSGGTWGNQFVVRFPTPPPEESVLSVCFREPGGGAPPFGAQTVAAWIDIEHFNTGEALRDLGDGNYGSSVGLANPSGATDVYVQMFATTPVVYVWLLEIEDPGPVAFGSWPLRQRQAVSRGSWPLRQRQAGGFSGSWPLRQRQTGL